ncbi:hypothetical protein TrVE_jg10564 [Triparma verrucosa]|uniref:N-acetyltransferase domain-containing protein n=1 Tax=Triparma verrucosa TaxID=1606542 RepID=A0A9W7KTW2_9STRA|nr:hypothetical protein TrVE_jg10564 [Triparma verrucosa]
MENTYGTLVNDCAKFFVDSFWSDKAESGALTTGQRSSLLRRQEAEFRNRYGLSRSGRLVVARSSGVGEVVGVAGVEIGDVVAGKSPMDDVPIMSNLAVGKQSRRRGVGGKLINGVENVVTSWGSDWLYLYVETTNAKAIKLYKKKGYRECGLDKDAKSLVPLENGGLTSKKVVCKVMRKRINGSFFQKLFNT